MNNHHVRQAFRLLRSHYAARPRLTELRGERGFSNIPTVPFVNLPTGPEDFRGSDDESHFMSSRQAVEHVFKCGNCFKADCRYVCRSLLRY